MFFLKFNPKQMIIADFQKIMAYHHNGAITFQQVANGYGYHPTQMAHSFRPVKPGKHEDEEAGKLFVGGLRY